MHYKAMINLNPSLLCNYLLKYCRKVNADYTNILAKDNEKLYYKHYINVKYMLDKLGLYTINKV